MGYKRPIYTSSHKPEPQKSKMTHEEAFLLDELGKQNKCSVYFYLNAFMVSLLPLFMFWTVLEMDLNKHPLRIALVTGVCTFFLQCATSECKTSLKRKLRTNTKKAHHEGTRVKEDKKPPTRTSKESLELLRTDRTADYEASSFALFYHNCHFIALVLLLSHVGFRKLEVQNNYVVSMILSALIVCVLASTCRARK